MKKIFSLIIILLFISISCKETVDPKVDKKITNLEIKKLTSLSVLQKNSAKYGPYNLTNRNWLSYCEGQKGDGKGVKINYFFKKRKPKDKKHKRYLSSILIKNGFGIKKYWKANNRVKELEISSGKEKRLVQITDTFSGEKIKLTEPLIIKKNQLEIKIMNVYKGSKYKDTCITELYLNPSNYQTPEKFYKGKNWNGQNENWYILKTRLDYDKEQSKKYRKMLDKNCLLQLKLANIQTKTSYASLEIPNKIKCQLPFTESDPLDKYVVYECGNSKANELICQYNYVQVCGGVNCENIKRNTFWEQNKTEFFPFYFKFDFKNNKLSFNNI